MAWTKCSTCNGLGYVDIDPSLSVIIPPPEQPVKQYKVVGESVVFNHNPGETFTAILDPQQEEALVTYGTLEIVSVVSQPEVVSVVEDTPKTRSKSDSDTETKE